MLKLTKRLSKGFSLVELMVTISIAAMLAAVGIPSMLSIIQTNRVAAETGAVVTALNYARSEAVTRKDDVNVVPSDGNNWAGGITVWTDTNGNGSMENDDTEVLQIFEALEDSSLVPSTPIVQITYNDDGFVSSPSAAFTLTLQLDDCQVDGRVIAVSQNGRVGVTETGCS